VPDILPPLSTLKAFEAVVRLGSVTRAAEALGRTHGAVSKQLRALHAHAGVAFFEKAGVGLRPTPDGVKLAAAVAGAFDALSVVYGEIVRPSRALTVHVACSATFAMRWLVPHLASFSAVHPDVRVRLSMTSAKEMRQETDADLVVLWDWRSYPAEAQSRAIRLADARFILVAAPAYPVAAGADGGLVAPCRIAHDHTARAWDLWRRSGGPALDAATTISFPHSHLCIEAAVSGLGVALIERRLAARELAESRLVALGDAVAFEDGFAAIPHPVRVMSQEARLFVDWLRAEMAASHVALA
jgi:DNA-binding transcriptional LysR family regulator